MVKSLENLLDGLDYQGLFGDPLTPVTGLAYDSRRVIEGDLFVAVRGTKKDGGRFIADALSRGARVIVSEEEPGSAPGVAYVRVADSRNALSKLAAGFYDHPSKGMCLIGVTGTNGKTTTTHLLEGILREAGHSVGVLGTLAYRWADKVIPAPMTTPESLDLHRMFHEMRMDGVTHVVMEVSSHALALGRVEGCRFKAGVFTNISQDHLDFHQTMEDYFAAKAILFKEYLPASGNGSVAVINRDDPCGEQLIRGGEGNVWSYSVAGSDARVWVRRCELSPSGILAELQTPSGPLEIASRLIGRLNLYNVVAAAATALALGIPEGRVAEGLERVDCVDGRLERVPIPGWLGYEAVVDYAHTPDAMEKSIGCLREMTRGRLIVVFGCGGDRDRGKRPLMGRVAAEKGDVVILTSDNPRSEVPERIIEDIEAGVAGLPRVAANGSVPDGRCYAVEPDRRRAIELGLSWAKPGDLIFIGGKGHETYQIMGEKVLPFDDRLVVQDYFRAHSGSIRKV